MRIKTILKPFILHGLDCFGINWALRGMTKTPVIFFWHGVTESPDPIVEGESVSRELFEEQISWIEEHFDVISIEEFCIRYNNGTFNNREALITFDDGYKNNLTVAAPILKKHGLPFTVFVSAQNINDQERFYILVPRMVIVGGELKEVSIPSMKYHRRLSNLQERIECAHEIEYTIKYYSHKDAKKVAEELINFVGKDQYDLICSKHENGLLLTWDDVRLLTKDYNCTIGSHCMDHCICHGQQSLDEVEWQLFESKKMIERETGRPCNYFAYPNGDFTTETNIILAKYYNMGFSTKYTGVYSNQTDHCCVGRLGVPDNLLEMKFLMSKIYLSSIRGK